MRTITIGRGSSNTIVLPKQTVSARHAEIEVKDDGSMLIKDLNSTNGTFVNGKRLQANVQYPVTTRDEVKLADQPFDLSKISVSNPSSQPNPPIHSGSTSKDKGKKNKRIGMWAAIAATVLVAGLAVWYVLTYCWTEQRTYRHYASAVGYVYVTYCYQAYYHDQLLDSTQWYYDSETDTYRKGTDTRSGTGFFIGQDGRLVTNLHMIKPWLFTSEDEILGDLYRDHKLWTSLQNVDLFSIANGSQINMRGKIVSIKVTPNGLPLSSENAVSCEVYRSGDDPDRDVAILQTVTHSLPNGVNPKSVIDVSKADIDVDDIKQGTKIFAIGFPYGKDVALADKVGMQNQIQSGSITQDHGEFEFGHNAASANGMSGSPIFNKRGHLVGIHRAGMTGVTGAQGFNWAVKAKYLTELNQN